MIMNSDTRLLEHVHLAGAILSIVFHIAVNHCAFDLSDAAVNMQISLDFVPHLLRANLKSRKNHYFTAVHVRYFQFLAVSYPKKL